MTTLTRMITLVEATALRECSKGTGPLSVFLSGPQDRIGLGVDKTPFRLVVKIGENPHFDTADIQRYKMGLWSRCWFKFGPHCRCCGQRIQDGEKALAFAFNPTGDDETWRTHWRKAFVHAEECA